MKTIFYRLIVGYLLIVLLILAVSIYMLFQLLQFERVTNSILEVDHRMEALDKKLTDSLLSQMRYEKKYMVTRDEALYGQFLLARSDFNKFMAEISDVADNAFQKSVLLRIKNSYQTYQDWIEEEAKNIRNNRSYPSSDYKREKEKIVDRILEDLQALAGHSRQDTMKKIGNLQEAGIQARQVAIIILTLAILAVIVLSLFITRSITHPISLLIGRTREIAHGVFEKKPQLQGPSEIRELNKAVDSMCDRLQEIDRMKSDFFSTVSHEMRTPLTSIKEGTNLLMDGVGGPISEKQDKLLKIIAAESKRLIDLVNSSLDLSKMEAGMMPFVFAPGEITPLIRKAVGEIEPLAMAKKIRLRVEDQEALPAVKMDRERMVQVLRNLLGNAVKFTLEGGEVKVSARREDDRLKVTVKDTGPGIPRENLASIFEKFQQGPLKNPELRKKGTGLGLAIVKQIVTAHGGKVWVESELGQGSSFIFVLPS